MHDFVREVTNIIFFLKKKEFFQYLRNDDDSSSGLMYFYCNDILEKKSDDIIWVGITGSININISFLKQILFTSYFPREGSWSE